MNRKIASVLPFFIILLCCSPTDKQNDYHAQNNAIWSESIYLRGFNPSTKKPLTDDYIRNFCGKLQKYNIKYVYLFAGPFGKDGHLPDYPFSDTAKKAIKTIREFAPGTILLPWIGGIQNKTIFLDDSLWVSNALNDTKKLIDTLGVEGVHLDFEFILKKDTFLASDLRPEKPGDSASYGQNVNRFHKKLRQMMPDAFISSVVTATCKDSNPWKRKTSLQELNGLLSNIDQISFLFYDTDIHDPVLFQKNCDQLVGDIKTLKEVHKSVRYLIAIGTFTNEPPLQHYRDLTIETIPNTLSVINRSLKNNTTPYKLLDGISIFCDWETDDSEWQEFSENWGIAH